MIVKSKHGLRTCSSRRFQWYPTTYMCWAMTKPLLWIKLILSHSKGWVGLKTYRLWGIIGIVLMSTCLIHGYFLRSRHFEKPRLFSREISTVKYAYLAQSKEHFSQAHIYVLYSSAYMAESEEHFGCPYFLLTYFVGTLVCRYKNNLTRWYKYLIIS